MIAPAKKIEDSGSLPRLSPHNVEAERQLLGAILMNNETFFRVSDFLEPAHFFVEQHKVVYEKSSQLIRAGKVASAITLKSFYPADYTIGDLPVTTYLLRLTSEATTIITPRTTAGRSTILPCAGT
ncbi:Replicative DNA helicase [Methylobrevis pamukkalensis]|uniref:Replicative DNA helicase n=1 Tax=Methylobrevis pamukkalensis TaxID=1439726 RepID=A0A1E3H1Z2_9HYPH|nr:Replicative DNA helicase [Methylobrevis pamukkalensis]